MNVDDLTVRQVRKLSAMFGPTTDLEPTPFGIGSAYLIRTVTYHAVGRVVKRTGDFLELESASWVADSGKFSTAIACGSLKEVEYVGQMIVALGAICDAFPWDHRLPAITR